MLTRSDKIILDTLLPADAHPHLPQGVLSVGFENFWAEHREKLSPGLRFAFRAGLLAANWASPLLVRRLPPLVRYDRSIREQALRAMGASRFFLLRSLLRVLKLAASICYATDEQVRRVIGYPGKMEAPGKNSP